MEIHALLWDIVPPEKDHAQVAGILTMITLRDINARLHGGTTQWVATTTFLELMGLIQATIPVAIMNTQEARFAMVAVHLFTKTNPSISRHVHLAAAHAPTDLHVAVIFRTIHA